VHDVRLTLKFTHLTIIVTTYYWKILENLTLDYLKNSGVRFSKYSFYNIEINISFIFAKEFFYEN